MCCEDRAGQGLRIALTQLAALGAALALAACAAGPDSGARQGGPRQDYRRAHRAYDGAPPVIPHAVVSLGRQDCLNCHLEGMDLLGTVLVVTTPHPERSACRQCHVEQVEPKAFFVASDFVPARHASRGTRAYVGAPPTLPHPRLGRENCVGCHGELGGSPIQSPHAERTNCLQCHVEQLPGTRDYHAAGQTGGDT
jgi:cytochrome c-type protein NapB